LIKPGYFSKKLANWVIGDDSVDGGDGPFGRGDGTSTEGLVCHLRIRRHHCLWPKRWSSASGVIVPTLDLKEDENEDEDEDETPISQTVWSGHS
jgi:hypothetical protein